MTYVVLQKNDQVIFHRRRNTGTEPIAEIIEQELREELGSEFQPEETRIVHVRHRNSKDGLINFFYTASAWDNADEIHEPATSSLWPFASYSMST